MLHRAHRVSDRHCRQRGLSQPRTSTLILAVGLGTAALFAVKGFASYGQAVILAKISSRIIASNQRRDLRQACCGKASVSSPTGIPRTSITRLNAGTNAASQVLNMLILAIGRDLLTLIGLIIVMVVQDPLLVAVQPGGCAAGDAGPAQACQSRPRDRHAAALPGCTRITETLQEAAAGHADRQGVHAGRARCRPVSTPMSRPSSATTNKLARVSEPRQSADGDARRRHHRARHDLWRL